MDDRMKAALAEVISELMQLDDQAFTELLNTNRESDLALSLELAFPKTEGEENDPKI